MRCHGSVTASRYQYVRAAKIVIVWRHVFLTRRSFNNGTLKTCRHRPTASLLIKRLAHISNSSRRRLRVVSKIAGKVEIGVVAQIDDVAERPEDDFIAGNQFCLAQQAVTVDERAVARAQVRDRGFVAAHANETMMPADFRIVQTEVAIIAASNQKVIATEHYLANAAVGGANLQELLFHERTRRG